MRITFDTNVLLAAFATRGLCEALFCVCVQANEIVVSEYILDELEEHLCGKIKMPAKQNREIRKLLRETCEIVEPASIVVDGLRDKDDLPVLGTAVAGKVEALVTGDAELLGLGEIRGVPIVSPRQLYERLRDD